MVKDPANGQSIMYINDRRPCGSWLNLRRGCIMKPKESLHTELRRRYTVGCFLWEGNIRTTMAVVTLMSTPASSLVHRVVAEPQFLQILSFNTAPSTQLSSTHGRGGSNCSVGSAAMFESHHPRNVVAYTFPAGRH